jgi:hypothetical protein
VDPFAEIVPPKETFLAVDFPLYLGAQFGSVAAYLLNGSILALSAPEVPLS